MNEKEIEYYFFQYAIPIYKIKPPKTFCDYFQTHKDEIIIELDKKNKRLNNIINELEKYIHNELILDFYDEDMPCELIINKMENMINKLKGDSSNE